MSTTTTAQRTRTPAPQQIDAALCHACRRAVVVIVFSADRDRAMDSQRGSCNIHLIAVKHEAPTRGGPRCRLRRHGLPNHGAVLGSMSRDHSHGSAARGLMHGLLISLLLWAGIGFAVWAVWLR